MPSDFDFIERIESIPGGEYFELGEFFNNKLGRLVPFQMKSPIAYSSKQLIAIGNAGAEKIERYMCSDQNVCIIAIEKKGVPIAVSIALVLDQHSQSVKLYFNSDLSGERISFDENSYIVVVDNSIITGSTMSDVLQDLVDNFKISPHLVLYLFDHCNVDQRGRDVCEGIEAEYQTMVKSLYSVEDFFQVLQLDSKIILSNYFSNYGNNKGKKLVVKL